MAQPDQAESEQEKRGDADGCGKSKLDAGSHRTHTGAHDGLMTTAMAIWPNREKAIEKGLLRRGREEADVRPF